MNAFFPAAALVLLLACPALASADPLKSPACGRALDLLEQARHAAGPAPAAEIETLRRAAARACLGGIEAPASRVAQPPARVPPPVTSPPPQARLPQPPAPIPPPVAIQRPSVVTACDPGGCWDSEGRRLPSSGPLLQGPTGPCIVSGAFAQCP